MTATDTVFIALPESTVSMLLALRIHPGEGLGEVVDRLAKGRTSEPAVRQPQSKRTCSAAGRYEVRMLGERSPARSLAEALARVLNSLADLDPGCLERLEKMGGRLRRDVARSKTAIHPGREDLNEAYTSEFRPGWWVGTNYSRRDTCRIIEDACKTVGLTYGRDIELVDAQSLPAEAKA